MQYKLARPYSCDVTHKDFHGFIQNTEETQRKLKTVFSPTLSPNPGSKTGLKGNSAKTQRKLGGDSDQNVLAGNTF